MGNRCLSSMLIGYPDFQVNKSNIAFLAHWEWYKTAFYKSMLFQLGEKDK